MVLRSDRCHAPPLARRLLPAQPDAMWRRPSNASLPRFYLHDLPSFARVRRTLRQAIIGARHAEEVVPQILAQHLCDLPLVEALMSHSARTLDPEAAEWHILAATPYASWVLELLQQNVTADGLRTCATDGHCRLLVATDVREHTARLADMVEHLETNKWWRKQVPFALITSGVPLHASLDGPTLRHLHRRNRRLGPVVLAGLDRSTIYPPRLGPYILPLLRRMVVLPYVASPEASTHAKFAAEAIAMGHTQEQRAGLLFHGDTGRADGGARGAVRDISARLTAPVNFRGLRLMSLRANASQEAARAAHRAVSQQTTQAMLRSSMCFVPRGDTETSRRLFDSLATGCVPVVLKVVGGKPREIMLSNLPFHHTLEYRALAHFVSAGGAQVWRLAAT